jgi:glutamate dehydrogenase
MQALLSIASEATPAEVINAILKAPVDLLWFGGIGTYVRAPTETDARPAIAPMMRSASPATCAREGRGRRRQSRHDAARPHRSGAARRPLNTDAIDNSAGVNSSDVEVNIKIALSSPDARGQAFA